jgi:hypothetical protein
MVHTLPTRIKSTHSLNERQPGATLAAARREKGGGSFELRRGGGGRVKADNIDGDVVVAIPRLPLTRNAVCEDPRPERKTGEK